MGDPDEVALGPSLTCLALSLFVARASRFVPVLLGGETFYMGMLVIVCLAGALTFSLRWRHGL